MIALGIGCGDKPAEKTDAPAETTTPSGEPRAAQTGATTPQPGRPRSIQRVGKVDAASDPLHANSPELKEIAAAEYPEQSVKAIESSCRKPWVIVARTKPDHEDFNVLAQALYANPAFKVVEGEPHAAGELAVEVHKKDDLFAVARCHDAGTCTRLAAMMKAVAKDSSPETGCGDLPNGLGPSTRVKSVAITMPKEGDSAGLCARLGACKLTKDPGSTEDPVAACQKSPSSFPVSCALKTSCDEVLSCH
jgi:hypothetical protein